MLDIPETRYAKTNDGLSIAYQTLGEGPKDIVMLDAPAIDLMWDEPVCAHFMRRLANIGRLICFDFHGFGSSDPVPLGALPTLEAWTDDILAVLDAVGSAHASLIGSASGGQAAIVFAATYPERTDALILVDSWARLTWAEDYEFGPNPEQIERFLERTAQAFGTEEAAARHVPSRAGDAAFLKWEARWHRLSSSPALHNVTMPFDLIQDVRRILESVYAPTLVLHPEANRALPLDHGRYLADHIPNARLVVRSSVEDFRFSTEAGEEVVDHIEEFITGAPPVREPDRALSTVLFTDIVSSTEQAARLGDKKWRQVLDGHDALVARELERHRGRKVNPTGDGILASFDGPARAVRCAQAICEAVRPLGIEVRAGLHTGEVELRGNDIGGIAVHIGQRVSALAGPGEVLVSRTVTDLVAGSGLQFEDRGEHELKGVPGRWAIYAVKT